MAGAETAQRGVVCLTILILSLIGLLATITIIQFRWTSQLKQQYEESRRELLWLQSSCHEVKDPDVLLSVLEDAVRQSMEGLERDIKTSRHTRQTGGSLQQMLTDMMVEQEKILMSHCLNSSKLCIPVRRNKLIGSAMGTNHYVTSEIHRLLKARRNLQQIKMTNFMQKGAFGQFQKVLILTSNRVCDAVVGQKGEVGLKGDPGLPGGTGLPGTVGAQGPKGDTGLPGLNGTKGDRGSPGIKGNQGLAGTQGSPGLKGDPGLQGATGLPGKQGPAGIPGAKGDTGSQGRQGSKGAQGAVGPKGMKGSLGASGVKGQTGPPGPVGPPGNVTQQGCECVVLPKIDIFKPNKANVTYPLGSSVDLMCGVSDNATGTTITWSGPYDGCTSAIINDGHLYIRKLQPSQLGTYTCTATNSYASVTKSVTISSNETNPLDCDFESRYSCYWKQSNSDSLDWINHRGPISSTSTSPDTDHTLGTTAGHFLYIESAKLGNLDAFAQLVSPELGATAGSCLSFWYFMNGNNQGALSVETEHCNSTQPNNIHLHLTGDQGRKWHLAQIQLLGVPRKHRIIINGVRGGGLTGHLAIDDIEFYQGKCKETLRRTGAEQQSVSVNANGILSLNCGISDSAGSPTYHWEKVGGCPRSFKNSTATITQHASVGDSGIYTCTATSGGKTLTTTFNVTITGSNTDLCTFEKGTCDWTQSTRDVFEWERHSGSTPSRDTGPNFDNTYKNASGYYMFIETSSPRNLGDIAALESHLMPGNQTACFSMAYHMYGAETGSLTVFLTDECTKRKTSLVIYSGDKGQSWHTLTKLITPSIATHGYRILVQAEVGSSYHGDIAIDDLKLKIGAC